METLPLENISLRRAQALNGIIGRRRRSKFSLEDNLCEFRFLQPKRSLNLHYFFRVKLSDYTVWVGMERMPELGFFAKEFDGVDLERLPEDVRPVVFEGAMDKLLGQLEETLGVVVSMESYQVEEPEGLPEGELHFVVKSERDGQRYRGVIYVDRPGLEFLGALIERTRPALSRRFNHLMVPVRLMIGQQVLSFDDYKKISPDDIILFNGSNYAKNGECIARFGKRYSFNAIFQDGKVTLGSIMDEEMAENENMPKEPTEEAGEDEAMAPSNELEGMEEEEELESANTEQPSEASEESSSDQQQEQDEESPEPEDDLEPIEDEGVHPLGQLPIKLVFEVGRRTLPLDELKSLQEGFVFELMNPANKPVTIRANGQVVGTGELLQIGERVGVRVSKFHKR